MTKYYDDIMREVRLTRAVTGYRGRHWRWDVSPYRRADGPHSGTAGARLIHIGGKWGYTYTRIGALIQISRALKWIETWR